MNKLNYFSSKTVRVANRVFLIHVMDFENGRFVSISEGENRPRLGSMFVSIATGPIPATTSVIPAKRDEIFLKMVAERTSTTVQGISVVSANFIRELDTECAKMLMSEIAELVLLSWSQVLVCSHLLKLKQIFHSQNPLHGLKTHDWQHGQFLKKNNSIYSRLLCVDYAFKGTASTS